MRDILNGSFAPLARFRFKTLINLQHHVAISEHFPYMINHTKEKLLRTWMIY